MLNNQIQCPNCGGYKVFNKVDFIYWENEYPLTNSKRIMAIGAIFLAIAGSLYGLSWLVYRKAFFGEYFELVPLCMLVLGCLIFPIGLLWFVSRLVERSSKKQELKHVYYCNICGYEWKWIPGEPLPKSRNNPGLREMGEEHLRRMQD